MWSRLKRVLKHRWLDDSAARRGISSELVESLMQRVKPARAATVARFASSWSPHCPVATFGARPARTS